MKLPSPGLAASRTRSIVVSTPPAASSAGRVEAKGLTERYRSAKDRRIVHARSTQAGTELPDAARLPPGDGFAEGLVRLPPEDRRAMLATLERLAALAGWACLARGRARGSAGRTTGSQVPGSCSRHLPAKRQFAVRTPVAAR